MEHFMANEAWDKCINKSKVSLRLLRTLVTFLKFSFSYDFY